MHEFQLLTGRFDRQFRANRCSRHQSQARAPLALAAVALGAGVSLAGYLHRPPWLWALSAALLAALAIVAAVRKSAWLGYLSVSLALVCTGAGSRLWAPQPEL